MSNESVSDSTGSCTMPAGEMFSNTKPLAVETQPDNGNRSIRTNNENTNNKSQTIVSDDGEANQAILESESNARTQLNDNVVPETAENTNENQTLLENASKRLLTLPATHPNGVKRIETIAIRRLSQMQPHCEKIKSNFLASAFGSVTTIKSSGKKQTINCRTVLWFLTFFGFIINYIYRVNINIAIVEMVTNHNNKTVDSSHSSECIAAPMLVNNGTTIEFSANKSILEREPDGARSVHFDWDEVQQGRILGAFFWLHWTLQVVGGIIAPRYGTKLIFGLSNFVSCFLCVFIPMTARYHINLLIALRMLQGFICSIAWPSMHHLCAQWIPPNERSKFVTAYMGSSVGIALCYPFFGWIMSHWSWEPVFYLSAFFGTVWYAAWLYFVYDSPAQHPRIDPMELVYIQNSLGNTLHNEDEKRKVPWSQILRSKPVWINILSQLGGVWGLFTLMAQAPTYFRKILGWDVQMTGLLSGFPHLARMIFAFGFSTFADSLLRNKRMSRTNVRRMACVVCNLLNGAFIVFLAFSGCDSMAAVIFLTAATAVHGAVASGPLASFIDMTPNYSSILLGLNGLVCVTPGFISPWIVGQLTKGNQTIQQWQYIFFITAGMLFGTGSVYVLFSDSSLQSWNQSESKAVEMGKGPKKTKQVLIGHPVDAEQQLMNAERIKQ